MWKNPAKNTSGILLDIGTGNPQEGERQAYAEYVLQDVDGSIPGIDLVCDIKDLASFIQSKQCRRIRASHILEHFGTHEVAGVLKMLHGLLEDDGELEIIVPNFKWHAGLVFKGEDALAVYYAFGGQKDPWDFHKTGFTPSLLKARLSEAGFQIVQFVEQSSITAVSRKSHAAPA